MSQTPEAVESSRMSFIQHLAELRRRLLYSLFALLAGTLGAFELAPMLFEWLRGPLHEILNVKMVVLSPLEMFVTYLKLAVMAAIFGTSPFILWQAWQFIAPGLYARERRWVAPFVIFGSLFFIGGGAFAFYVVLPLGFKAMIEMLPESVEATYSVGTYFDLVVQLMLAFGAIFELPLVMWILAAIGLVSPQAMGKFRKYWLIAAFVVAGVLTPPDVLTQTMMAVPLIVFFELGILGARLLYKKPGRGPVTAA